MEQSDSETDAKYDDFEQYGRRNNIRLYGIKENEFEDSNKIAIDVVNKLDINISSQDICCSHRIGKKSGDPNKPRQIIAKLVRHDVKAAIMKKRKILRERNPGIGMNEDLTRGRMMAIKKQRERGSSNILKTWTVDETINIKKKNNPNSIISVRSLQDLDKVLQDISM